MLYYIILYFIIKSHPGGLRSGQPLQPELIIIINTLLLLLLLLLLLSLLLLSLLLSLLSLSLLLILLLLLSSLLALLSSTRPGPESPSRSWLRCCGARRPTSRTWPAGNLDGSRKGKELKIKRHNAWATRSDTCARSQHGTELTTTNKITTKETCQDGWWEKSWPAAKNASAIPRSQPCRRGRERLCFAAFFEARWET